MPTLAKPIDPGRRWFHAPMPRSSAALEEPAQIPAPRLRRRVSIKRGLQPKAHWVEPLTARETGAKKEDENRPWFRASKRGGAQTQREPAGFQCYGSSRVTARMAEQEDKKPNTNIEVALRSRRRPSLLSRIRANSGVNRTGCQQVGADAAVHVMQKERAGSEILHGFGLPSTRQPRPPDSRKDAQSRPQKRRGLPREKPWSQDATAPRRQSDAGVLNKTLLVTKKDFTCMHEVRLDLHRRGCSSMLLSV